MTTFTDVFERKEVKYRLDAQQHRALVAALRGRMAPDAFGRTRIASCYFDTSDRAPIERSLDKPLYKEKLRLRGYGAPQADDRVFVEIKKKYKGIVCKRRVGCSLAAARAYMEGLPYKEACARFPLPDAVMAAESLSSRSMQIACEIDAFAELHRPLRPSMLILCERTAYVPFSGCEIASAEFSASAALADVPNDLRITFDADIAYRDLFAARFDAVHALLPVGDAVMEVKSSGPFPLWLVRALDACAAYPSSFSKYGEAYRACAVAARRSASVPSAARTSSTAARKAERLGTAQRACCSRRFRVSPAHSVVVGSPLTQRCSKRSSLKGENRA